MKSLSINETYNDPLLNLDNTINELKNHNYKLQIILIALTLLIFLLNILLLVFMLNLKTSFIGISDAFTNGIKDANNYIVDDINNIFSYLQNNFTLKVKIQI